MSQHDLVVDNGPGINVRLDLNQAIQALGSMELGTVSPAPTYPCQRWADQSTGLLKKRNTANTAWLADGKLDVATAGGVPVGGAAGAILTKNSAADGDMVWVTGGTAYLPTSGGTISGNLTVSGQLNVGGQVIASSIFQCNVPAGSNAIYYGMVAGVRQWYWGVNTAGTFVIADATGGVQRMSITTAGAAAFANNLTCSGNFNTNQINGTVIVGSTNFQLNPASGAAWYYATCAGVRQWQWGANTDGGFYIFDSSGGATRMLINTAGNVVIQNSLTVSGNLGVSGNLAVGGSFTIGGLSCSSINNSGPSTLVGTVSCNAISCSTINTNSNTITCGGIDVGTNAVDTAGTGIGYTGLSANRVAFQNISGTNLTFYINGVAKGVQTFGTPSDIRLKQNIGPVKGDALDELRRLELISFDMPMKATPEDNPAGHYDFGFSAQNVKAIIPDAVFSTSLAGMDDERDWKEQPPTAEETYLALDVMPLVARCIGAIQQLAARLETLEGR